MLLKKSKNSSKVVAVSGGFDPLHVGHIRMFEEAKKLGDKLVVIVNGDFWLERKKGKAFMPLADRMEIIRNLKMVDYVIGWDDGTENVCGALEIIKPDIFANGGDRKCEKDIPEAKICKKLGIKMAFNVGGKKLRSSSELLRNYENNNNRSGTNR